MAKKAKEAEGAKVKKKKKKTTQKGKSNRGAKSKYDERLPKIVLYFRRVGYSVEKIAEIIGCHKDTLYSWAKLHPELSVALKEGKDLSISTTADSLFKVANGFEYEEVEESVEMVDEDGEQKKKVKKRKMKKYIPPDVKAIIFYLCNRAPDEWKNQFTAMVGGKVNHNHSGTIEVGTMAALAADAKEVLARRQLAVIQGGKGGGKEKKEKAG